MKGKNNISASKIKFSEDVSETLLIPLWMRAIDPKLNDVESRAIVEKIDYDFEKFSADYGSRVGVRLRTLYFKNVIQSFINNNEDAVVVLLGCGLDPQARRIHDRKNATFYAVDLPDVISLSERLLPDVPFEHNLAKSALEENWMAELSVKHKGRPFLFIAEGLLMYFTRDQVDSLFSNLQKHFRGSQFYLERMSQLAVSNQKHHKSVSKTNAAFQWAVDSPKEITNNHPVTCIADYRYLPNAPGIFGFIGKIAPPLGNSCGIYGFQL